MKQNEIKADFNGMPPVKDQYDDNEKKLIAEVADKYEARPVAMAYGLKWQAVVAWKKHYGTQSKLKKTAVTLVIQYPDGHEITMTALLEKVGRVVTVYIRADECKAYWVLVEEHGAIELW